MANKLRADAASAIFRQQRYIYKASAVPFLRHQDSADGLTLCKNDLVVNLGIGLLIPALLRIELHPQKRLLLWRAPAKRGDFVYAGAGVQLKKKILVLGRKRTQLYIHDGSAR